LKLNNCRVLVRGASVHRIAKPLRADCPQGLFASDLDKIHLENSVVFEYNTHRQESKHKPAYKA
jgi:hypothetical protein